MSCMNRRGQVIPDLSVAALFFIVTQILCVIWQTVGIVLQNSMVYELPSVHVDSWSNSQS